MAYSKTPRRECGWRGVRMEMGEAEVLWVPPLGKVAFWRPELG